MNVILEFVLYTVVAWAIMVAVQVTVTEYLIRKDRRQMAALHAGMEAAFAREFGPMRGKIVADRLVYGKGPQD